MTLSVKNDGQGVIYCSLCPIKRYLRLQLSLMHVHAIIKMCDAASYVFFKSTDVFADGSSAVMGKGSYNNPKCYKFEVL